MYTEKWKTFYKNPETERIDISLEYDSNVLSIRIVDQLTGNPRRFKISQRSKGFIWYYNFVIIPKFSSVSDGISWFENKNQWQKPGYKPMPGDIIFFDWEGDGSCDHVGIVEKCDENTVYTIEGNSRDECRRKTYSINSSLIFGYGVPKY